MVYNDNEGPVYSYLGAKENSQCNAYCVRGLQPYLDRVLMMRA